MITVTSPRRGMSLRGELGVNYARTSKEVAEASGRRLKRHVGVRWTAPDVPGAGGGELSTPYPNGYPQPITRPELNGIRLATKRAVSS